MTETRDPQPRPTAPTTVRLDRVDTARGGAIVLVLTHHAVLFATAEGLGHPAWTALDETLRLLRMPLFFFLSGMLAVRAVHRPWPDLLRRRVGNDLWVHLLWATAAFLAFTAMPSARDDLPTGARGWLDDTVLLSGNGAWYLLALALYLPAGRLLRAVPTAVLLSAAAVLAAAFGPGQLVRYSFVWSDVATLFVYFVAGLRLRDLALRSSARVPGPVLVAAGAAATGTLALAVTGLGLTQVPGVRLLVGTAAVVSGTALAAPLSLLAPALLVAGALAVCLPLRTPLTRVPWLLHAPWAAPRQREVRPTAEPAGV